MKQDTKIGLRIFAVGLIALFLPVLRYAIVLLVIGSGIGLVNQSERKGKEDGKPHR